MRTRARSPARGRRSPRRARTDLDRLSRLRGKPRPGNDLDLARLVRLGGFRLPFRQHHVERLLEPHFRLAQRDAILRPLRTREARFDGAQVQLDDVGEHGIGGVLRAEDPLLLRVALDEVHFVRGPPGLPEVGAAPGIVLQPPDPVWVMPAPGGLTAAGR